MCGIAGLIHRRKTGDVGTEMTNMLKSLKHRGPDSTGFALYGQPKGNELVLRFKVAEQDEMKKGFDIHGQVKERRAEVDKRLKELGATNLMPPTKVSCMDHEGSGLVKFQQWDGAKWKVITDWMEPDRKLVRAMVEADAAQYAKEKNITPRDCSKDSM